MMVIVSRDKTWGPPQEGDVLFTVRNLSYSVGFLNHVIFRVQAYCCSLLYCSLQILQFFKNKFMICGNPAPSKCIPFFNRLT